MSESLVVCPVIERLLPLDAAIVSFAPKWVTGLRKAALFWTALCPAPVAGHPK